MTATVPSALQTHIDTGETRLARIWTITTRLGDVYRFTSHDRDIVYGGETFTASEGFDTSALEDKLDMSTSTVDLTGILGTDITRAKIRAGLLDGARADIEFVRWDQPTDGAIKRHRGWLGEVKTGRSGAVRAELRGLTQALAEQTQKIITPGCPTDLGSTGKFGCKVPVAPPVIERSTAYEAGDFVRVVTDGAATGSAVYEDRIYECTTAGTTDSTQPTYDETVGNTTTDGTAVFTARQAWTRAAVVDTVTSSREFTITVDEARAGNTDWFKAGKVTFETGPNAGITIEISEWDGTGSPAANLVRTFLPFPFTPEVGNALRIVAGCDKSRDTCNDKFANGVNFQGYPDVPGADYVTRYVTDV